MNITPYEKNAKKHPKKQIEQVAASIKEFGMNQPIVVDKQGVIIVGHGRFEALKHLGWEIKDEYIKVVDLTEEQARAYRLADNKLNESEWDMALVVEELKGLSDEMIELSGFDSDLIIEPDEKDDEVPETPEDPQSKLGDLYELGSHRVLCGDSTKIEDVEQLMDGKKADMVFTDPPYGISIVGDNGKVGGDNKAKNGVYSKVIADETTDTARNFYNTCLALGMENFIIWGGNYFVDFLPFSASWIIWDKRGDMNSNNFADGEMAWCSFETRVRIYKQLWNGMIREGEKDKRVHPTQKPIKVLSEIITDQIKGNLIFDGFLGSGSTLIAAEKTGRICYGMELDPKYVDVIVQRYCDYTGNYNIRKNGEDIVWQKENQTKF